MNEKLVLINQNTLESLEETDVVKIVEKFVKTGIEILGADFGFMFWKLENQEEYQLIYKSSETPYQPKLPRKRGYNYKASKGRIPYFVSNPKRDLLPYMKSLAIIPIFYKNYQYGNIVLCFKKKHTFNQAIKPLTVTLSNSAAQVLTIYRNYKKTERNAQKLLKQKDEFFNIVSHELKTPVTTIKGFSQILSDKLDKSDSKTKYFLEKINSQVDKLSRLVNDMLDVSRIETGKLSLNKSNFELQKLIEQVVEDMKVAAPSHSIIFKSNYRFWINGDSERIESAIINLITNAVKYSPAGSKIKVCLTEKEKKAYVEVEDFGYGIMEKDMLKIFNRFFRSKDANKETLGLGLGLYIANSIVKGHNGNLGLKSKNKTKGTIFYFTLPYYKCMMHKK